MRTDTQMQQVCTKEPNKQLTNTKINISDWEAVRAILEYEYAAILQQCYNEHCFDIGGEVQMLSILSKSLLEHGELSGRPSEAANPHERLIDS